MAKPQSIMAGTLDIPHETFYAWASTFLPNTNPAVFYTFGKLKDKQDSIEVPFTMSSVEQPPPPTTIAKVPQIDPKTPEPKSKPTT